MINNFLMLQYNTETVVGVTMYLRTMLLTVKSLFYVKAIMNLLLQS